MSSENSCFWHRFFAGMIVKLCHGFCVTSTGEIFIPLRFLSFSFKPKMLAQIRVSADNRTPLSIPDNHLTLLVFLSQSRQRQSALSGYFFFMLHFRLPINKKKTDKHNVSLIFSLLYLCYIFCRLVPFRQEVTPFLCFNINRFRFLINLLCEISCVLGLIFSLFGDKKHPVFLEWILFGLELKKKKIILVSFVLYN